MFLVDKLYNPVFPFHATFKKFQLKGGSEESQVISTQIPVFFFESSPNLIQEQIYKCFFSTLTLIFC